MLKLTENSDFYRKFHAIYQDICFVFGLLYFFILFYIFLYCSVMNDSSYIVYIIVIC